MSLPVEQIEAFGNSGLCTEASPFDEGGITYLQIKDLKVPLQTETKVMDAVLCPTTYGGYATRLFLAENLNGLAPKTANWGSFPIAGRTWYSWSWQGVAPTLSLTQMVVTHLQALR